jgi:hypothetical protein
MLSMRDPPLLALGNVSPDEGIRKVGGILVLKYTQNWVQSSTKAGKCGSFLFHLVIFGSSSSRGGGGVMHIIMAGEMACKTGGLGACRK